MNTYSKFSGSEEKNRKRLLFIGLGGALLAVCVAAGCLFFRPGPEKEVDTGPSGIVYDQNAVEGGWESLSKEEITAALNSKVEEGMINISMNTSPVFADGRAEGNLMIVNQLVNTYPQKVELYRSDTGELIYTSDAVPVGSKIASDALDVVLEAGAYECTAMFHALDPETGAILGSAGAVITVTIQS